MKANNFSKFSQWLQKNLQWLYSNLFIYSSNFWRRRNFCTKIFWPM